MVGDYKDMQDWAVDCDGEGRERVVRDSTDSRVVMMVVVVEDGGGRQQWQRRTAAVVEDNGMQDRVVDYDG